MTVIGFRPLRLAACLPALLLSLPVAAVVAEAPAVSAVPAVPAMALSAQGSGPSADTTVTATRGQTLRVTDLDGILEIRSGEGDVVRVEGDADRRLAVELGGDIHLRPRRGPGRAVKLLVTVPSWMPVEVRGRELAVTAGGLGARVDVQSLEGDVTLRDVGGPVSVQAVDGDVELRNVRAPAEIRSVDGDVRVLGHRGRLTILATDGDLILEDVVGEEVAARTVDGDVSFTGVLREGGRYTLSTHSGDLEVGFPAETGVAVAVSTFDGDFEAAFPVVLERYRSGETVRFVLGDGGATLELEAFDGEIRLYHGR